MNVGIDIIEPCGFPFGDAALRRAGLDYIPKAMVQRHTSWQHFRATNRGRIVLATTKANAAYTRFKFDENDTLLLGQESAGVPDSVADACEGKVRIEMAASTRSLNVAVAAGMILGEIIRQTRLQPSAQGDLHHEH